MQKLIFVYNANSGISNTILDVAHKLFSPKTYNCNLCAITHNTFSENKDWKQFRKQSNIEMTFLHIDEFEEKYTGTNFSYPVVLTKDNIGFKELLSTAKIETIDSVEILITEIKKLKTTL